MNRYSIFLDFNNGSLVPILVNYLKEFTAERIFERTNSA